jgi:GAF domain-containing protein
LLDTLSAEAAGVYWHRGNSLAPVAQLPARYVLDQRIQQIADDLDRLEEIIGGQDGVSWLVVPMRASAVTVGRLWTVMPPNHLFSEAERELLILVGNQLAMAQENLRLYREVKHLAERRGALLHRLISMQDERWIYYAVNKQAVAEWRTWLNEFLDPARVQERAVLCGPEGQQVAVKPPAIMA